MTAPIVLRAVGSAGATHYTIHSAAATIDANGTVNITPLTDLIVANAAGQIADAYFASGNFANLSQADLDAESAALKAKLLPVLQAMKVDAAIDLLRTQFTPLASALDQALDVIRVSVDPATATATITNLLAQVSITDDLAKKAAAEGTPATLPATDLGTAADDIAAARAALTSTLDLFKTSLPSPATVQAKLAADFLESGMTQPVFANGVAGEPRLVGASFAQMELLGIDYAAAGGATATLRYVLMTRDGKIDSDQPELTQVRKESDGVWRWRGNQDLIEFSGGVQAVRNLNGCTATGYEFNLHDNGNAQAAAIAELRVNGPGLPAEGMRYRRSTGQDAWAYSNGGVANPSYYRLASSGCGTLGAGIADATIAAIPDNASYTLTAFDAQGASVALGGKTAQTRQLAKRARTMAETLAAPFPTIVTSTPLGTYSGGSITISGTGANPARAVWVYLGYTRTGGEVTSTDQDVSTTSAGAFSTTLSLGQASGITGREIRVATRDEFGRSLLSNQTN